MKLEVNFIGYVEYKPTFYRAEFVVRGHHAIPDGIQMDWDTLLKFNIPIPTFPAYHTWTRERYEQKMVNRQMLRGIWGDVCQRL